VTYGVLNLAQRAGSNAPAPMIPGREALVTLRLKATAYAFLPGHRIRLALSNAYWPIVWPEARAATFTVRLAGSTLDLPIRAPDAPTERAPFGPAETAPPLATTAERAPSHGRRESVDERGRQVITMWEDRGSVRYPSGLIEGSVSTQEYRIRDDDPLSAEARVTSESTTERGAWKARVLIESRQTATAAHFRLQTQLRAYENGVLRFSRDWDQRIARPAP
jgi:hypothetical protein